MSFVLHILTGSRRHNLFFRRASPVFRGGLLHNRRAYEETIPPFRDTRVRLRRTAWVGRSGGIKSPFYGPRRDLSRKNKLRRKNSRRHFPRAYRGQTLSPSSERLYLAALL